MNVLVYNIYISYISFDVYIFSCVPWDGNFHKYIQTGQAVIYMSIEIYIA
jgi:hypothetical protein